MGVDDARNARNSTIAVRKTVRVECRRSGWGSSVCSTIGPHDLRGRVIKAASERGARLNPRKQHFGTGARSSPSTYVGRASQQMRRNGRISSASRSDAVQEFHGDLAYSRNTARDRRRDFVVEVTQ
jgi:hypothetical protein